MDTWTVPLIFFAFFGSASLCLILVYKYGIKTKSYEEAVAEHRKQTSAFLASSKPKLKDKKNKKATKKINKEKSNESGKLLSNGEAKVVRERNDVSTLVTLSEQKDENTKVNFANKDNNNNKEKFLKISKDSNETKNGNAVPIESINIKKPIVELKHQLINISPKKSIQNNKNNNNNNKNDVTNKDKSKEVPKTQPISKQEQTNSVGKVETKKDKEVTKKYSNKNDEKQLLPNNEHTANVGNGKEHISEVEKIDPDELRKLNGVGIKDKKKKKKENDLSKHQIDSNARDQLKAAVRKAELTRTELQELIELLLNKQQESPAVVIDEWSEGKSDPIQKLKKQLAEKEKSLSDEQDALAGLQAKLKQIRNEQAIEKANLKASEASRLEILAANNRLQQSLQELDQKYKTQLQMLFEEKNAVQMQRDNAIMNYQKNESVIHSLTNEGVHLNNELQRLTHELQEMSNDKQQYAQGFSKFQEEIISIQTALHEERESHQLAMVKHLEEKNGMAGEIQRLTNQSCSEEQRRRLEINQLEGKYVKLQEERDKIVIEERKRYEIEIGNLKKDLLVVSEKLQNMEAYYKHEIESIQHNNKELLDALNSEKNTVKQLSSEVKSTVQNEQKDFLQKLFPEIIDSLNSISNTDLWKNEYEHIIRDYLSGLKTHLQQSEQEGKVETKEVANNLETHPTLDEYDDEVLKLRGEVRHYKNIIEDTENILKKLETHIANEEHQWKMQIAQKDKEIEELKHKNNTKFQGKLAYLQNQLDRERHEKQQLLAECNRNKLQETTANNMSHANNDNSGLNNEKGPSTSKEPPLPLANKEPTTVQNDTNFYQNGTA